MRSAQQIVDKINARFPHARAVVWGGQPMIGEQSYVVEVIEDFTCETPMVDYHEEGSSLYPNGMLPEVEAFVAGLGLYGEWHDPGTMVLYEI